MAAFRIADEDVVRDAVGAEEEGSLSDTEVLSLPLPFALTLRKGEAVLLTTGGVCVLDGGLLGLLIEGLSQDEKKSSPGSPDGVTDPSLNVGDRMSMTVTSSGNLETVSASIT